MNEVREMRQEAKEIRTVLNKIKNNEEFVISIPLLQDEAEGDISDVERTGREKRKERQNGREEI